MAYFYSLLLFWFIRSLGAPFVVGKWFLEPSILITTFGAKFERENLLSLLLEIFYSAFLIFTLYRFFKFSFDTFHLFITLFGSFHLYLNQSHSISAECFEVRYPTSGA